MTGMSVNMECALARRPEYVNRIAAKTWRCPVDHVSWLWFSLSFVCGMATVLWLNQVGPPPQPGKWLSRGQRCGGMMSQLLRVNSLPSTGET